MKINTESKFKNVAFASGRQNGKVGNRCVNAVYIAVF